MEQDKEQSGGMMESIDPDEIRVSREKVGERRKIDEMDFIDPDEIKAANQAISKRENLDKTEFVGERKKNDEMDIIDVSEYRKSQENELINAASPIEMKSTQHIERAKREEIKKENAEISRSAANEVFDWFESIITAVLAIILIFTFIVRLNTVDGDSMNPTLVDGQKLVVTDLFYTPDYNDIVIVQAARLEGGKPLVKRIIGLPGDTIRIDFENGTVYRNGTALEVTTEGGFLYEDGHTINSLTNNAIKMESNKDYIVPENCYFILGDNRNDSRDSRDMASIGFLERNYIAGHAIFSVFPFNTFGFTQ